MDSHDRPVILASGKQVQLTPVRCFRLIFHGCSFACFREQVQLLSYRQFVPDLVFLIHGPEALVIKIRTYSPLILSCFHHPCIEYKCGVSDAMQPNTQCQDNWLVFFCNVMAHFWMDEDLRYMAIPCLKHSKMCWHTFTPSSTILSQ